ncbi:MAG: hypothetical protein KDB05_27550 [Planctomycetales bacterium]|nr:hypothetical protein [Planctomycetales bacterium]
MTATKGWVYNPAFDVMSAEYVKAIITEQGATDSVSETRI